MALGDDVRLPVSLRGFVTMEPWQHRSSPSEEVAVHLSLEACGAPPRPKQHGVPHDCVCIHLDECHSCSRLCFSYPLVYSILIVPLSIVRFIGFHLENIHNGVNTMPSSALLFVITIYGLSGAANVLLFFTIRSNLLLFRRREPVENVPLNVLPPHQPDAPAAAPARSSVLA
jgi:hypothetical protein